MRPAPLYPIFSEVTALRGVGPQLASGLKKLLRRAETSEDADFIPRTRDLLFHLPVGIVDRTHVPPLYAATPGEVITVKLRVDAHHPAKRRGGGSPYRVACSNETGSLMVVYFNGDKSWIEKRLPVGQERVLSGKVELYDGYLQMPHPDIVATADKLEEVKRVEPVYPLSAGITSPRLAAWVTQVLSKLPELPEWHAPEMLQHHTWPTFRQALFQAHHPASAAALLPEDPARLRLAGDEILASQLALGLLRQHVKASAGYAIAQGELPLSEQVERALPFTLTEGQKQVLAAIRADMSSGKRMLRLLQGDVGSGKTVVALLAMLDCVAAGYQVALMAPTEILTRQHFRTFTAFLEAHGVSVALLTGSLTVKEREEARERIAGGDVSVIIGTHALFQEQVQFKQLGFIVIDEQHRFGVMQRVALAEKGNRPHVLLMTATPIPRSLLMMLYGDMDTSSLKEKPAGRTEIVTRAIPLQRLPEVIEAIRRALAQNQKIYWICPLIEEEGSTVFGTQAAEDRYTALKAIFGEQVGLVHGKMKAAERHKAMEKFSTGAHRILVATTVIEVGVDIPDATVMMIENAERFGLSQLHQLRGRVGRSDKASSCLLLYDPRCTDIARERLKIIRNVTDGFVIAEEDLRLRGGGEVLGTRQSGAPDFYFADMYRHRELVAELRDAVQGLMQDDPYLRGPRGEALRLLLTLFDHDRALKWVE